MTEIEKDIRKKYGDLLKDPDFDRLELELKTPNIFEILGVSRTEIRHSNFLSWLLDPNGTHGLGKLFLIKFLRDLTACENANLDVFEIEKLNFDNVKLKREWRNPNVKLKSKKERSIDLLIIFHEERDKGKLVICIENKIGTQDSMQQLEDYKEMVDKTFTDKDNKVYVYLTLRGEEPNDKTQINDWVSYSYEEIIDQIDSVLEIYGKSLNSGIYQYIFDYLITLKREIAKDTDANELAEKVYKNHKELFDLISENNSKKRINKNDKAKNLLTKIYLNYENLFDFVFKNKLDIRKELMPFFEKKIEDLGWKIMGPKVVKGGFRFLTQELQNIIPSGERIECFLFEIWFWEGGGAFKSVITESTVEIQELLCDAMESIPEVTEVNSKKKPTGKGYISYTLHKWEWNTDEVTATEVYEKNVEMRVDKEWEKIKEIVEKVEEKLENYIK